jgi:peptidoglycan/LPS O-acetylase OafA/YrhL
VAILLVVLYHSHVPAITGGYVGVDVFFVISGFLITGQLARELAASGRVSFLGFYARRARRILPAATLVTTVTVIASALLLNPLAAQRLLADARSAVFFGANFHFAARGADYFNAGLAPSPLQHYWSLSVEEQFYIVWPLLLVASSLVWLGKRRPARSVVVVVLGAVVALSLLASIRQTPASPAWAYYSILTRCWELAAGALVALAPPFTHRLDRRLAGPLTWVGLVCIAVAVTSFGTSTPYPGDAALLPVAGAVAIIAGGIAAGRRWGVEALLGTAPFQRVGSWSYSWYLWHWPALLLAPALLGHPLSVPDALGVSAFSLGLAIMSFVLVERPIRGIHTIVRRPVLGLACGGVLAAGAFAVVAWSASLISPLAAGAAAAPPALAAHHQLTPSQLTADLVDGARRTKAPPNLTPTLAKAARALPVIVKNDCHLQHSGVRSKPCIYGDARSHTSVVLFGDSHAAAWFPALDLISEQQHWRLVDLTKAGCPPAEVSIVFVQGGAPYPECTAWRRNAQAQIAALHPALVVMAWARYIEQPEARALAGVPTPFGSTWQNGLAAIFRFLHNSASHVVFISDTPTLRQLAPDCVAGHISDVRPCTTPRHAAIRLQDVKSQELELARKEQIDSIDPTAWFCAPTKCPVIVGNILLYRDNAHMSPAWSRFIAPVLADSIVPTMRAGSSGRPAP